MVFVGEGKLLNWQWASQHIWPSCWECIIIPCQIHLLCCTTCTHSHAQAHSYPEEEDWTFSENYIHTFCQGKFASEYTTKDSVWNLYSFFWIYKERYEKYNILQMFNGKPILFITQYCEVEWVFIITLKQSPHTTLTLPFPPSKGIQLKK